MERAADDRVARRRIREDLDVSMLVERINHNYGRGADPSQLETIERSLAEVHERLSAMTPAAAAMRGA